jgi:hypothetical protein
VLLCGPPALVKRLIAGKSGKFTPVSQAMTKSQQIGAKSLVDNRFSSLSPLRRRGARQCI